MDQFLDAKERERKEQMNAMREVLDALKEKEWRLQARALARKNPESTARVEKKRELGHAQRKKGLRALRALRDAVRAAD